jgi:hypothetical protein
LEQRIVLRTGLPQIAKKMVLRKFARKIIARPKDP